MKTLILKKNEERRLARGHLWVFSNEVENLSIGFEPGELVEVRAKSGRPMGVAHVNPHSLICARLVSRSVQPIDRAFLRDRIAAAKAWRDRYIGGAVYRLFYSEADGFPGLIVDRYGDQLVVQAQTRGAYAWIDALVEVLGELCRPVRVLLRNDNPSVELEGLQPERRVLLGGDRADAEFELDGVRFRADLWSGQKTGFYLDQRENRRALAPYVADADVLDGCCYSGAWALSAARFGARAALGIDSSAAAIDLAQRNAELNGCRDVVSFARADIDDALEDFRRAGRCFDVVCLDPPPFARIKKHLPQALKKYEKLNEAAMRVLRPGGILVTCSCSAHVQAADFEDRLARAANRLDRRLLLLERRGQARDHPVLPAMRETAYLKCVVAQVQA